MLMRVYQHRKGAVMNSKLKTPAVEQLFDAILSLENKEECAAFFEDLCTINELLSLSQRFEVAKMLREKRLIWTLRKRQALLQQPSAV